MMRSSSRPGTASTSCVSRLFVTGLPSLLLRFFFVSLVTRSQQGRNYKSNGLEDVLEPNMTASVVGDALDEDPANGEATVPLI